MARSLLALATMAVLTLPASADNRFRQMYRWIPGDVNMFVAADLNQIYRSPLATREKWSTNAPLSGFSPFIQFLLLGARVDPQSMDDHTEYGVAYMNTNITMADLAQREGGAVESLADTEAVLSPRNCFFVSVAPFTIGMVAPAVRADATKWVRFGRANAQPHFSVPIQAGIASIVPTTQFLLVLDLADAVHLEEVRAKLKASKALKGQDSEAFAKVVASVQSLRLDIAIREAVDGTVTVTFGENPSPLSPVAKPLLSEILANRGVAIDELESWTATTQGNSIVYKGAFNEQTFRRIISLLAPPAPQLDHGQVEPNSPLAGEIRTQAAKRYFESIQKILTGLKSPPTRVQQNFQDFEGWYDKAAESIAELPRGNVDADLLKFAQFAHDSLKAIAASARGESVQIDKAANSFRFGIYNTGGGWGGWRGRWGGGIYLDTNLADVNQAKQQAIDKGTQTRIEIWTNLMAELENTRKAMYEKFKVPF